MPFQNQATSQLTQAQSDVLGKLKSYSSYGLSVPKVDLFIPVSKQISLFDYIKQLFNSIGGKSAFENLLKTFLQKLFNPASNYLETQVINALAHSLDAQNISINKGTSNKDWLTINVLPGLDFAKDQIFNLLLSFIFGPPSFMTSAMQKADQSGKVWTAADESKLLEMASCGQSLYTVSNLPDQGVGDLEYNKIQLQNQLSTGGVVFNISCQKITIQMPASVLATIVPTMQTIPGTSNSANFNPTTSINALDSWVQTEVARQNVPENQTDAGSSFFEGFIEKILNLMTSAITPKLIPVFSLINSLAKPTQTVTDSNGNPVESTLVLTPDMVTYSPCDIYNEGLKQMAGKPSSIDQKASFTSTLINALLGLLLSILLAELIKAVKKIIMNVVAKKAEDLAQRIITQRLAEIEAYTGNISAEAQRAAKLASALTKLKPILQMII